MAPKGPLGLAHLVNFHSSALLFRYDFFEKSLAPMISKNAIQIGSKFRLFGGVAPKGPLGRAHLVNFHSTAPVFRSVSMGKITRPHDFDKRQTIRFQIYSFRGVKFGLCLGKGQYPLVF